MNLFLAVLLLASLALAKQPNILFILTDDQGKLVGGLDTMKNLTNLVAKKGATYNKHYCSVALCCPSRANMWSGRMPHNTNVTNVEPPYGGYPQVVKTGMNDDYLPIWMQKAGYKTYYVGKLWNAHTEENYDAPFAKGFDQSDFLLDPWTYRYNNARMTRNNKKPVHYDGSYSTDVLSDKAAGFLDDALKDPSKPWMLTVAPNAPHSNGSHDPSKGTTWFGEPVSAPRHKGLFENEQVPRDASFNKLIENGVGWTKDLPALTEKEIKYIDYFHQQRLRALQAVDEMVGRLVQKLEKKGELDNTYIIYSTDNGYHLGQHRMQPGKNCGYETDISVPLIIRGPGVPEGASMDVVTSHTDIAPTFLSIAGVADKDMPKDLDGKKIPTTKDESDKHDRTEHVAVEYWGGAVAEGIYGLISPKSKHGFHEENTYKAVRLVSDDYSLYYSVWCTNVRELFDMKEDPHQTTNLAKNPKQANRQIAKHGIPKVMNRLNALILVLKSCTGDACREPWKQLHPGGNVKNLADALNPSFDQFYARQPKVSFSSCKTGYLISEEGPQHFNVFGGAEKRELNGQWEDSDAVGEDYDHEDEEGGDDN
ncbi:hypothetical protein NUU61_001766 [Penicillium alfredii]|uniref:Arylsulfatase n=1 Tax=Penicillium alfredii TaxID=1506179 RepID=A0A9W9FQG8_9EURO|nr:uncharacterized protein NUU61_001766 [Penicillium alfredii]KAJ5104419.1 hypothetical protein NUU61_001766 [Penicillium alfredii]